MEKDTKFTGVELIAAERARQISQEGWTPEHDDRHAEGELWLAADCYRDYARKQILHLRLPATVPPMWPWEGGWWKPSEDPIRNIVKAEALMAAEIDRIKRVIQGEK